MGVLRAMLGGDLTGPPRSYALRRRGEARTLSRNGIGGSGGVARGFTAFFAALRSLLGRSPLTVLPKTSILRWKVVSPSKNLETCS
jgi:hypothetical protein